MNLAKSSSEYPLPASLFLRNGGDWLGTWGFLDKQHRDYPEIIVRKQIEYGSKLFTFLMYNMVDPREGVINPFVGNPTAVQVMGQVFSMQGAQWDQAEVERWKGLIASISGPGSYTVPTIFCGDDRATTRNKAFVDWFIPQVIWGTYQWCAGYNLISEASKSWNPGEIDYVVGVAKNAFRVAGLAPKPILVHQQGYDIGTAADCLMYEFHENPWDAQRCSPRQVIDELKTALCHYPKDIWPQELAVRCEEPWARAQVQAIIELARTEPRIVGLPGPR